MELDDKWNIKDLQNRETQKNFQDMLGCTLLKILQTNQKCWRIWTAMRSCLTTSEEYGGPTGLFHYPGQGSISLLLLIQAQCNDAQNPENKSDAVENWIF